MFPPQGQYMPTTFQTYRVETNTKTWLMEVCIIMVTLHCGYTGLGNWAKSYSRTVCSVHAGTSEVEMYLRQVYDSPIAQYISHTTKEAAGEVISAVEGFQHNQCPAYSKECQKLYKECMLRCQYFVQVKQTEEVAGEPTTRVPLG